MSDASVWFNGCQPILRVEDMQRSLRFYLDVLGFQNVEWGTDEFTSIRRDKAALYLCRKAQGAGRAWVYVGVDDVNELYKQLLAKNISIRLPPTNFFWALELHAEDPDGNVLRFGSDPLSDRPFEEATFG